MHHSREFSVHIFVCYLCMSEHCSFHVHSCDISNFTDCCTLSLAILNALSDKDKHLVYRVGAVIATNFMATMTVTIMMLLSLVRDDINSQYEALVSFIIFPVNSILNPTFNTFVSPGFIEHHHGVFRHQQRGGWRRE